MRVGNFVCFLIISNTELPYFNGKDHTFVEYVLERISLYAHKHKSQ